MLDHRDRIIAALAGRERFEAVGMHPASDALLRRREKPRRGRGPGAGSDRAGARGVLVWIANL